MGTKSGTVSVGVVGGIGGGWGGWGWGVVE